MGGRLLQKGDVEMIVESLASGLTISESCQMTGFSRTAVRNVIRKRSEDLKARGYIYTPAKPGRKPQENKSDTPAKIDAKPTAAIKPIKDGKLAVVIGDRNSVLSLLRDLI